ncbi:MAG TPA: YolD-like family protein [Clostridiales bacterium]|nr:YolD-like family protein [Clostridiales bacterium]
MEYPLKSSDRIKHPRMTIENRAKIFAPFAALKGYEEAIAAKQKIVVARIELSEESKEFLDLQLGKMEQLLSKGQHPIITVVYFQKDKDSLDDKGEYIRFTGMVSKLDLTSRMIQIVEKRLPLDEIYKIEGEDLDTI